MNKALKIVLIVAAVLVFFLLFGKKLLGGVATATGSGAGRRGSAGGGPLSSFLNPVASGAGSGLGAAIQRWLSPAGGTPIVPTGLSGPSSSPDVTISPPVEVPAGFGGGGGTAEVLRDLSPNVPVEDSGTIDIAPAMV